MYIHIYTRKMRGNHGIRCTERHNSDSVGGWVLPAVSPRVSCGVRCSPHGILEPDKANDGVPADLALPRPPRRPKRTPPHQRGGITSQTRRPTRRSTVHSDEGGVERERTAG